MHGIGFPFDEERERLDALQAEVVGYFERPPPERLSIRAEARTVARSKDRRVSFASGRGKRSGVGRRGRPGNQSRLDERAEIPASVEGRLQRVGGDDLEILPSAEREEGVPRAGAGMTPARD